MKRFSSMAAIVAIASIAALPVSAGEKKGRRLDMSGASQASIYAALNEGNVVCIGTGKMKTCMMKNPLTGEIRLMETARPEGVSQNVVINRVLPIGPDGEFRQDAEGRHLSNIQDVRSNPNAAAMWTNGFSQVPAALTNGLGASLASALINRCNSDYGCGNNFNMNNGNAAALSESGAFAGAEVNTTSTGGCGSGGCPTGRK